MAKLQSFLDDQIPCVTYMDGDSHEPSFGTDSEDYFASYQQVVGHALSGLLNQNQTVNQAEGANIENPVDPAQMVQSSKGQKGQKALSQEEKQWIREAAKIEKFSLTSDYLILDTSHLFPQKSRRKHPFQLHGNLDNLVYALHKPTNKRIVVCYINKLKLIRRPSWILKKKFSGFKQTKFTHVQNISALLPFANFFNEVCKKFFIEVCENDDPLKKKSLKECLAQYILVLHD